MNGNNKQGAKREDIIASLRSWAILIACVVLAFGAAFLIVE
jgi:hypothetical protein